MRARFIPAQVTFLRCPGPSGEALTGRPALGFYFPALAPKKWGEHSGSCSRVTEGRGDSVNMQGEPLKGCKHWFNSARDWQQLLAAHIREQLGDGRGRPSDAS